MFPTVLERDREQNTEYCTQAKALAILWDHLSHETVTTLKVAKLTH